MLKRITSNAAIAVAVALIAFPLTTVAQEQNNQPGGEAGVATSDCANGVFSFGAGVNSFQTCVSSHGNVAVFNFAGSEVINLGTPVEGYVVCAVVSGVARVYHDVMFSEAGWGAAVATSPGALPITINRTTTDGAFTLTQTYAKNNPEREFNVTNKLKANVPVQVVKFVRVVDIDVDENLSGSFADTFDNSLDSVWGAQTRGFTAKALTYNISHYPSFNGFATACDNAAAAGPVGPADLGAAIQWNLGNMNAGNSKTVKIGYEAK
jgi:hypothetical protein